MKTKQLKKKNQKPIEIDVSFKYNCPNKICEITHWLFLRQAQTQNFKVVCECGTVFKPKQVKTVQIVYTSSESVKKVFDSSKSCDTVETVSECVRRATNIMVSLGYQKDKILESLKKVQQSEKIDDYKILVKKAISKLGGIDE